MEFKCPYCGATRSKKTPIYLSWKSVATHTNSCVKNNGEFVISLTKGPIHYTYLLNNTSEFLQKEFSKSKYHDMLDKFRLNGFITSKTTKKYSKEECIEAIKNKAIELGKTPDNTHFRKTEGKYPSIQYIVEMFGSWNNALIESGFELHKKSELYGIPTKALDNHVYRSKVEAYFVDKFLYNKYNYVIEPNYPSPYNKLYDWYVKEIDCYIELDGQIRPEITEEKIKINKELNRCCLFIPTYIVKSPNKNSLIDFLEYKK